MLTGLKIDGDKNRKYFQLTGRRGALPQGKGILIFITLRMCHRYTWLVVYQFSSSRSVPKKRLVRYFLHFYPLKVLPGLRNPQLLPFYNLKSLKIKLDAFALGVHCVYRN